MEGEIENPLIFFEINNFYANHRNFVRSRSYAQLRGKELDEGGANSACEGAATMEEIGADESWGGSSLADSAVASPCGLIAKH